MQSKVTSTDRAEGMALVANAAITHSQYVLAVNELGRRRSEEDSGETIADVCVAMGYCTKAEATSKRKVTKTRKGALGVFHQAAASVSLAADDIAAHRG